MQKAFNPHFIRIHSEIFEDVAYVAFVCVFQSSFYKDTF